LKPKYAAPPINMVVVKAVDRGTSGDMQAMVARPSPASPASDIEPSVPVRFTFCVELFYYSIQINSQLSLSASW